MKHAIPVLLLALSAFIFAQAQKNPQAQGTDATEQTLKALEEKWVAALTKSDTATLDSILSDTYVDTDEHGQRTDKQGVLAVLKSGDLKFESVRLSDMQVHHYGDAAVVTGAAVQAGTFKDQPLIAKIVFTDTFIRQNGKWSALASHRSTGTDAADLAAIKKLEQEDIEVTLTQDPKGLVDVWAEDGVRFKPGSLPTIGKAAIAAENEKFHTQYPEFKVLKYAPDPKTVQIAIVDGWAIEVASADATYKMSAKDNPVSVQDKSMRLLKRQSDGSWKFALVGLK